MILDFYCNLLENNGFRYSTSRGQTGVTRTVFDARKPAPRLRFGAFLLVA